MKRRIGCLLPVFFIWPVTAPATVDIALSVASNPSLVVVDRATHVFAEVFNFGDEMATDVVLTATLPTGSSLVQATTTLGSCSGNPVVSCSLGDLPAGTLASQAAITLEVALHQTGSINHVFALTTTAADTELTNNDRTATVEVVGIAESADIGVNYGLMPTTAFQGVLFSVPINVLNHGPQGASDVVVEFTANGLTLADLVSSAASPGSCSSDLDTCIGLACIAALQTTLNVRCELGPLSSGEQAGTTVSFDTAAEVGEIVQLTVEAFDRGRADPDLNNNRSSQAVETIAAPDISVSSGAVTGCFIATAAYGSELHEDVELLRQFRDDHLLNRAWGRLLVATYYRHSPALAEVIRKEPQYKVLVRALLKPVIWMIRYPLLAVFMVLLIAMLALRRRNAIGAIVAKLRSQGHGRPFR